MPVIIHKRCIGLLPRLAACIAFALPGLLGTAAARADNLDTWNINFGTTVMHDNNLFRLPSSANTQAQIGKSSAAETITASTLGFKVNKPYSLQRFELDLNLVKYDYRNFDYLNFTARNYTAAWRWSLTPYLKGNFTANHQESLNSFTDYRNFNTRNQRTDENRRFDADLDLGAGWHLLGGVFESIRKNSALFIQEADSTITSSEAGGRYVFTSGARLGFLNRTGRGTYDKRSQPIPFPTLLDNKFDQTENQVNLFWPITGKTSLDARLGRLEHKKANYSQRDFSGINGALNLNWEVTGKTRISGGWTRDLSSYESSSSSYAVSDRYFFSPVWQISAKTALRMRYDYSQRNYLGAIIASPLSDRRDIERSGLIAVDWQPMTSAAFSASLTNSSRSSNQPDNDFKDLTALISAQFSF